jgi:hypothetical protein
MPAFAGMTGRLRRRRRFLRGFFQKSAAFLCVAELFHGFRVVVLDALGLGFGEGGAPLAGVAGAEEGGGGGGGVGGVAVALFLGG